MKLCSKCKHFRFIKENCSHARALFEIDPVYGEDSFFEARAFRTYIEGALKSNICGPDAQFFEERYHEPCTRIT